jgi:hypothetical protein
VKSLCSDTRGPATVHNSAQIDAAIAELADEPGGGLIMVPDAFNDANHEKIAKRTRCRQG